ncbi:ABC transporter permease [Phototrophicus methaneseepsis]|uniref:ABC transporter permease n=1 Tax=Phototrophicus methaneseepsis TaxID=2710758 RepID=A0A7S8E5A1_9CHLR|nr:ABC transporter permease [Phototrophicus methaneseepsis]QPC80617.1 ABC transporter permease [Phototrophicus methaneseepsis]
MKRLTLAIFVIAIFAVLSLFIGVSDVTPQTLLSNSEDGRALQVLLISRIPRTLAIILSGASMAIAGLIMQILARNNFVEPSTAGTVESASMGILFVTAFAPGMPLFGKMLVATIFALAGTALFLRILQQIPLRSVLIVPLVGMMLGGVISAITTFFAYRLELLQSLNAWMMGSFAGVLRGRYELLWISLILTLIAYIAADQFTVAGMGQDFTTNLGMNYNRVMTLGLIIVSMVTAVNVVTVGMIPFLGLVVPNVVRLTFGDNVRLAVPWIAVLGTGFVLICDMIGRIINFPYEIPISVVIGVIGSFIFLYLLLRRNARVA